MNLRDFLIDHPVDRARVDTHKDRLLAEIKTLSVQVDEPIVDPLHNASSMPRSLSHTRRSSGR